MKKSVIVVEDDRALREKLVEILETAPDIKCLGAFVSAEDALPQIFKKKPDVVLMDIKLPGMSGIECVDKIKKEFPAMQVLMVTIYEDSDRIFRALKAGANGYLIKSRAAEHLLAAIRDVNEGGSPMSSHIARKVVDHFRLIGPSLKEAEKLSPREREVLELLAQGFIYKEIGEHMGLGVETIRTYVKTLCHKMHVRNRLAAVAKSRIQSDQK